jgi:hypothetical protein
MTPASKRSLGRWLSLAFIVALLMGPGPGALLIRAAPGESPVSIWGVPILYLWTVFWAVVMAAVVVLSSHFIWSVGERKDQ